MDEGIAIASELAEKCAHARAGGAVGGVPSAVLAVLSNARYRAWTESVAGA